MSCRRWFTMLTIIALVPCAGCASKYADFGEPMKLDSAEPVSIAKILAAGDKYDGEYMRVSGKVASVCAKKGCWLRMSSEGANDTVFVKFTCPVDGRLIPMEAVGHDVVVEGTVTVETLTQADARHYAEDAGKSPEEIAKIVGSRKQMRMKAPAARILGMPKK